MKTWSLIIAGIVLSLSCVAAQEPSSQSLYQQARSFEQQGEYEQAESLYVRLIDAQPDNYTYYNRYRNILVQTRDFERLLSLLKQKTADRPYDIYLQLELGVLHYRLDEQEKAIGIWKKVFETRQAGGMVHSYAVGIYQDVLEYGMGTEFYRIADILREITQDPSLLVEYDFSTAVRYRNWTAATREVSHILTTDPAGLRYVRSELFKHDPGSDLYRYLIDELKNTPNTQGQILLSDIYVHMGKLDEAYRVLSANPADPLLRTAMAAFANRTYDHGAFEQSSRAATWVVRHDPDTFRRLSMALLSTESREALFRNAVRPDLLLPVPYASKLSDIRFLALDEANTNLIASVYGSYDSLSAAPGIIGQQARFRHAGITYQVYRDFDRALKEYRELTDVADPQMKRDVLSRISDLYLAMGDPASALEFLKTAPEGYRLMVHEEDQLMPYILFVSVMNGDLDSLDRRTSDILALLPEDDPMYNDVLAFSAQMSIIRRDSLNRDDWLIGERSLLQDNLAGAMDVFSKLMKREGPATGLYALRYLECLDRLKDPEKEKNFWDNDYSSLLATDLGDYFMIRYARYLEKMKKVENAIDIFDKYLLSYRESVYYETVRAYVRQHYPEGAP